jgi:hypothetical protein
VPPEVPTADVARRDGPVPNRTAEREPSEPRIRIVREGDRTVLGANSPEVPVAELRWLAKNSLAKNSLAKSSLAKSSLAKSSLAKSSQVASDKPSVGRRMRHAAGRFCIAVLIGVGATLAWQSHGDQAKEMIGTWASSLGGFLFTSTATSVQVSARDEALPQLRSSIETTPAFPAQPIALVEAEQRLNAIARNLATVRKSVDQLTAKQEEMARNMATLQAAEDIRRKISSGSKSNAIPLPPRKKTPGVAPAQPVTQSTAVQSSSLRPVPIPRPPVSLRAD